MLTDHEVPDLTDSLTGEIVNRKQQVTNNSKNTTTSLSSSLSSSSHDSSIYNTARNEGIGELDHPDLSSFFPEHGDNNLGGNHHYQSGVIVDNTRDKEQRKSGGGSVFKQPGEVNTKVKSSKEKHVFSNRGNSIQGVNSSNQINQSVPNTSSSRSNINNGEPVNNDHNSGYSIGASSSSSSSSSFDNTPFNDGSAIEMNDQSPDSNHSSEEVLLSDGKRKRGRPPKLKLDGDAMCARTVPYAWKNKTREQRLADFKLLLSSCADVEPNGTGGGNNSTHQQHSHSQRQLHASSSLHHSHHKSNTGKVAICHFH